MAKQKLTDLVIDALEDIKARDIFMYNVTKLTSVFDHIVTASAESTRQTKALARHVMDKAREAGFPVVGVEGEQSGEWVLVDLGDIVIHIMQPAIREYYKLEELWQGGVLEFPRPVVVVKKAVSKVKTVSKAKTVSKVSTAKAVSKPKTETKKKAVSTAKAVSNVSTAKAVSKVKPVTKKKAVTKTVAKVVKKVASKTKPVPTTVVTKKSAAKPATRRRKTTAD